MDELLRNAVFNRTEETESVYKQVVDTTYRPAVERWRRQLNRILRSDEREHENSSEEAVMAVSAAPALPQRSYLQDETDDEESSLSRERAASRFRKTAQVVTRDRIGEMELESNGCMMNLENCRLRVSVKSGSYVSIRITGVKNSIIHFTKPVGGTLLVYGIENSILIASGFIQSRIHDGFNSVFFLEGATPPIFESCRKTTLGSTADGSEQFLPFDSFLQSELSNFTPDDPISKAVQPIPCDRIKKATYKFDDDILSLIASIPSQDDIEVSSNSSGSIEEI